MASHAITLFPFLLKAKGKSKLENYWIITP